MNILGVPLRVLAPPTIADTLHTHLAQRPTQQARHTTCKSQLITVKQAKCIPSISTINACGICTQPLVHVLGKQFKYAKSSFFLTQNVGIFKQISMCLLHVWGMLY